MLSREERMQKVLAKVLEAEPPLALVTASLNGDEKLLITWIRENATDLEAKVDRVIKPSAGYMAAVNEISKLFNEL